jgi:two-component system, chemotaxis family, chemotaxis protein CheY
MASPRVMICDDSKGYRKVMSGIVENLGYELVAVAANGQEAVDLFAEHTPDLLLLDINMPEKTGVDALEEILDDCPEALVIMLTSVAEMETVERCIEVGAINYILKDGAQDGIEATIRETWDVALEEM